MLFSNKKKSEGGLQAVFDIGSGSVGGALVFISDTDSPKIIYGSRKPITFQKNLDFKRFNLSMLKAIKMVSQDLLSDGIKEALDYGLDSKKIEKVLCVFSSPWYLSETKVIHLSKKSPVSLSRRFIEDIISSEESEMRSSSEVKHSQKTKEGVQTLERLAVDIKLNGYTVLNPYNKKATEIELTLFISVSSGAVLRSVKDVIESNFHVNDITLHSSALANFSSLRDAFPESSDFVVFDMSAEVSDFFLIKNEKLLDNTSFPLGANTLIRAIMEHFETTSENAYSTLHLISENKLEEGIETETKSVIEDVSSEWRKLAKEALETLEEKNALPDKIFLVTAPRFRFFAGALIKELWKSMDQIPPEIKSITPADLGGSVEIKKNASADIFLMLNALYAQKIKNDS